VILRLNENIGESARRISKYRRKRKATYTQGELNRLIDGVFHPLCKEDRRFVLLDLFFHGLVERNLSDSVRKFFKYNMSDIVKEINEKL
jgi:hypothetical protein